MLAMAVVTGAVMLDGVRASRPGRRARARADAARPPRSRCVWLVLGSTAIYLAFNGLYVITLAFASNYGAGGATVLSYAYLFASYLVAATGFALGMSRIADMRRGALADWREVIADTVPPGFRYAMLIVAPALAALVAGGATLIGEVLPSSFDPAQVDQLRVFGALLCAWTVAALLVNLLLPALFALGRVKLVNALAPALVALHVAVTALGGALFGVNGVVGAFFVAPLPSPWSCCWSAPGAPAARSPASWPATGSVSGRRSPACFGVGALVGEAVGPGHRLAPVRDDRRRLAALRRLDLPPGPRQTPAPSSAPSAPPPPSRPEPHWPVEFALIRGGLRGPQRADKCELDPQGTRKLAPG